MKRKTKYQRQIEAAIRTLTDEFTIEHTRNGHLKVIFEGIKKASVIFGGSPSDPRTTKNCMADVRRAMITAGIQPKEA